MVGPEGIKILGIEHHQAVKFESKNDEEESPEKEEA